jgi:hypothetical protein
MSRSLLLRSVICLAMLGVALEARATADSSSFKPVFRPQANFERAAGRIVVDGRLDDSGWQSVAPITNFVERSPGDNTQPTVSTTVRVTYDDSRLYVSFSCEDDPGSLRATMCQRDQWSGDDAVCVLLDTYGNGAWAYQLFVNPHGIQKDLLWTNLGQTDIGFDLIWESSAHRTETGYDVEIAIPFGSLRFPDQQEQVWRMDFWRNRPREVLHQYSWTANDRSDPCWLCQWGTVTGIEQIRPGKGFEILPSVVAFQSSELTNPADPASSMHDGQVNNEVSLGGKYALSSDITLEATYNPDFSQIEADAAQIDVNSPTALFYSERRPFFQEGSDIFQTMFNSFYTRTINAPQFAAKLTGRSGHNRIGVLAAYDENSPYIVPLDASSILLYPGKSMSTVIRGSRQFGQASQIGLIVTDRRFDGGGAGTLLSGDLAVRLTRTYSLAGQYIYSYTEEPTYGPKYGGLTFDGGRHTAALDGESYHGDAYIVRFNQATRHTYSFLGFNQISPTYRTQNGFDPVNNHRTAELYSSVSILPKSDLLVELSPQLYASRRWDFATGQKRYDNIQSSLSARLGFAQTQTGIAFNRRFERWQGVPFSGMWRVTYTLETRPTKGIVIRGEAYTGLGLAYFAMTRARETSYASYLTIRPVDRITVEPTLEYLRMNDEASGAEYFSGYITRTKTQLQVTKQLSLRLIVQYDDFDHAWDIDPLLTLRLSPFSLFYLGSSVDRSEVGRDSEDPEVRPAWRTTSRQFFMKLQYLLRT